MKKIAVSIVLVFGILFINGCTPENITEDESIEIQATGHKEVGDPDDQDDEDEIGG